jgi:hypothetical protein
MADNLLNVKKLLKGTEFEKYTVCIETVFKNAGITTIEQVDNLPAMGHICFCDVYQLVTVIRQQYFKPAEPERPVSRESRGTKL